MNPEEFFKIKDSNPEKLPERNIQENKSSDQKSEDVDIKTEKKETTIDDVMSFLKDNKIQADQKTIQNYYNQIVENKKIINEYNQTINELQKSKPDYASNEKSKSPIPESTKDKLAEINTLKREKEDEIKSTINNIFNENKSEDNKNVSFETKNNFLNLVMKDSPKEENITKVPEKVELPKEENITKVPEKVEVPKEENITKVPEKTELPKEENITKVPEKIEEKREENITKVPEKVELPKEENITKVPENEKEISSFLGEENKTENKETKEESYISQEKPTSLEKNTEESKVEKTEDNPQPFSDLKKEENSENMQKESEASQGSSNKEDGFAKLSESMQKGFESVLNAIKGIPSGQKEPTKTEQKEEPPSPQRQQTKPQENASKTPQKNYIDEYRDTLRSNAPLKGYAGIKGIELKANNIGSYL